MFQVTTMICGDVLSATFDTMESAMEDFVAECNHVDDCRDRLVNKLGLNARDISEDCCAKRSGIKVHGYQMDKPNGDTVHVLTFLVYVM